MAVFDDDDDGFVSVYLNLFGFLHYFVVSE